MNPPQFAHIQNNIPEMYSIGVFIYHITGIEHRYLFHARHTCTTRARSRLDDPNGGTKMSVLKIWISTSLQTTRRALGTLRGQAHQALTRIKGPVSRILSPVRVEMSNMKDEVWLDLSRIYYKYEDMTQKKAFREVVLEMSDKINDGNWEAIYKKLYRIEHTSIT